MSDEELGILDRLVEERGESRSEAMRSAIRRGAGGTASARAPVAPRGEVGMGGAAGIAGLTIAEMIHEANERGVLSNYDEAALESDVEVLSRFVPRRS